MNLSPQPSFLKALQEVFKIDVAAIALSVEDLFFMANELCPQTERIRYGTYLRFIDSLDRYGEPTEAHEQADLLLEIHCCIKAEQSKQRMAMLKEIMLGQKDWRRLVWLLQWQEKQERQKNAQAKQLAKEQKEREKAIAAADKLNAPIETEPTNEAKLAITPSQASISQPAVNGVSVPKQSHNAMYYEHQEIGKTG